MTSGNLHDVFIPYNAALYRLQGMVQHRDFHTPFGWIYSELNLYAWRILMTRKFAGINELIPMASLLWLGVIVVLYGGFLLALPPRVRPTCARAWLFLLFLALVVFNFKGVAGFSVRDINWYGTYNNHMWGVVLLQLVGVFLVIGTKPDARGITALALLNGVGVFLTCNYKISFGLASLALAGAPLFSDWGGVRWRLLYAGGGLAVVLLLTLGLVPAQYDWRLYAADLHVAALAKAGNTGSVVSAGTWLAVLMAWLLLILGLVLAPVVDAKDRIGHQAVVFKLVFATLVIGAVLVSIMGDFARPDYFILVCLALFVLMHPVANQSTWGVTRSVRGGALAVLLVGIIGYAASDFRVAHYKLNATDSGKYEAVVLDTPYGPLKWTIRKNSGFDPLSRLFRLDEHPQKLLIQSAITYREHPYRDDLVIAFKNADYVAASLAIKDWMRQAGVGPHQVVSVLDFINPIPLLTGSPMPHASAHWVHFGTSVPMAGHDEVIFASVAVSDVLVVPIASYDNNGQSLLNCRFHEWNKRQERPFVPVAAGRFHLFYKPAPQPNVLPLDEADIDRRCRVLLEMFRSGAISPN